MRKVKKNTKSSTPVWVWVIIILIFIQIGKLAQRNDLFKKESPKQNKNIEKKIESLVNRMEKLEEKNNK